MLPEPWTPPKNYVFDPETRLDLPPWCDREKLKFQRFMTLDNIPLLPDKGPNGRSLCRLCRNEVPRGRRSWCSKECLDYYGWRNGFRGLQPTSCAICNFDIPAFEDWIFQAKKISSFRHSELSALLRRLNFHQCTHQVQYDIDHIVPVIEGGGCCGPENLQILCPSCHKLETRKLAGRRAEARRLAKGIPSQMAIGGCA